MHSRSRSFSHDRLDWSNPLCRPCSGDIAADDRSVSFNFQGDNRCCALIIHVSTGLYYLVSVQLRCLRLPVHT